jgi:exopolyphosphatase / guanosine-5'-triphosphate,3'-diphosphate pyrophosphatase
MAMPRYAAIDIGSNSIRMEAAEVLPGQPAAILASDREVTRLGEGVFRDGMVNEAAIQQTCAVLDRMAALHRKLEVSGVRAVATSAIRDAANPSEFLARASQAAGTEVEIISGREEARLIHLGVQTSWPQPGKRVLVIDVGGGSAEIVASDDGQITEAFSRPLGAVRLQQMFLDQDPPTERRLLQMREFIEEKLAPAVERLARRKWDRAIATSATASAVVSAIARVPRNKRDDLDRLRITAAEVRKLFRKLSGLSVAERRKVTGIGPRRAEIIVPGVAVLERFVTTFDLRSLYFSRAGVRDGIIADLAARGVGGERSRMSRDQRHEVEQMGRKFGVELVHARKVAAIGQMLFAALEPLHHLAPAYGRMLEASAFLLDTGHYVGSVAHHKHSWYVVANSDLACFTQRERRFVAALCRYHRKSMPSPVHTAWQALSADERRALLLLIPVLRLADNLDRTRDQRVESVQCRTGEDTVVLEVRTSAAIDLEQWAAERAAEVFRQIYGRAITVVRAAA